MLEHHADVGPHGAGRGLSPGGPDRAVEIGTPCITTRPSLGVSSSAKQRSNVVLPEPDGPTMQTTSRSITGSETRVST